jgi:hypothetical protein
MGWRGYVDDGLRLPAWVVESAMFRVVLLHDHALGEGLNAGGRRWGTGCGEAIAKEVHDDV